MTITTPKLLPVAAVLVASVLAGLAGYWGGLAPQTSLAAALSVFAVGFWALGLLAEYLTGLLFLLGAMLLAVAPAEVVFSGFTSKALWLVFGGLIIGMALKRTGLAERVAASVGARFDGSYTALVSGVVLMGVLLAFAMPSTMGRVLLLLPITLAMAERAGFQPGDKGHTGLVLAAGAGTYLPAVGIMPATVPVMVLIGAAETQHDILFSYGDWLLLHFPILGLAKIPLIIGFTAWMFRDTPKSAEVVVERGGLGRDAKLLAAMLLCALGLWATDSIHGISPAWISLAAGVLCLMPGLALVPQKMFAEKFQFGAFLFVGAILGLGAVVDHTGLGDVIASGLLTIMPLTPGADLANYASFVGLNSVVGLVTSFPGQAAVMTPLAPAMAEASGWPLDAVLHTQVISFAGLMLPYQTPPMLVAASLGGVALGVTTRYLLILWAVSMVSLVPLNYAWWLMLGVV